ncbi:hypothetical protein H311_01607, partial [Anncaliia algerae PRA109]
VNHFLKFFDPQSRAHTQHIESSWAQEKMKGITLDCLPLMLKEFMWKNNYKQDIIFQVILLLQVNN